MSRLLSLALLFVACTDVSLETSVQEVREPGAYDALAYDLRARFDWAARQLIASEDITVQLAPGTTRIELDARVEIQRVFARRHELAFERDAERGKISVDLAPLTRHGGREVTFTVEFVAPESRALIVVEPEPQDPIPSRVYYTIAEPNDGAYWLVAKHDPSDRARFSVELELEAGEDAIAPGRRRADGSCDRGRVARYAIDMPIPTYVMAFAGGDLEQVSRRRPGRVPLGMWTRRGFLVDRERLFDEMEEQLRTFERKLGPYPWQAYAMVALPQFPGGMENVGVTFVDEYFTLRQSASIGAHELAHQWFGDWVTIADFDDLWIKEGVASLLQSEPELGGTGRLFGLTLPFAPGDAIVDRALSDADKYTSGPYARAGWLLGQIRNRIGDRAFFRHLRAVLADHALGSIDSETFVRSFAPELDAATIDQVLASLETHESATLAVERAGDRAVTISLADPARVILDPIDVTVVDAAGLATVTGLRAGAPVSVVVPEGGYLALDERDVHPRWSWSFNGTGQDALEELMLPASPAALETMLRRPAGPQEEVTISLEDRPVPRAQFAQFFAGLDSKIAREVALLRICGHVRGLGADEAAAWAPILQPIVVGADEFLDEELRGCGPLDVSAFAAELAAIGASERQRLRRVAFLLGLDYGPARSRELVVPVFASSPSGMLRDFALARLVSQARGESYAPIVDPAEREAWRDLFRGIADATTTYYQFATILPAIVALGDRERLVAAGAKFHVFRDYVEYQSYLVCQIYEEIGDDAALWAAFRANAEPLDTLSPGVAAAIADPVTACE